MPVKDKKGQDKVVEAHYSRSFGVLVRKQIAKLPEIYFRTLKAPLYENHEASSQIADNPRTVATLPPLTCCFAFIG